MYIKPMPDRLVPDPEKGGILPPEGRYVSDYDIYWLRRISDGDVEKIDQANLQNSSAGGEE